jgi:hypothetical protein
MTKYYKKLWGGAFAVLGLFFIGEHIISWGEFTFFDFVGHEWLGLILFLGGLFFGFGNFKKPDNLGDDLKYNFKKDILNRFKRIKK